MLNRQLRFADLQALNIVDNRVTLKNWIANEGFPPGRKLGPNIRAWDEGEVLAWMRSRPTEPRPPTGRARHLRAAAGPPTETSAA
jgi:hypothetical protein